jgi:hypothetical protein
MKSLRFVLFTMFAAILSVSTASVAQGHDHKAEAAKSNTAQAEPQKSNVQKSDAQKTFDELKTVAGEWEGPVAVSPPQPQWDTGNNQIHVSLRVTSRGHVLVHELQEAGTPLDATKYDHPVTMMYLDNDRLNLVHYCDAGNRPHMIGKVSPDGKTVEFDFADLSGPTKYGHMHHAVFTLIDANHHIEEWTYMLPGDKPIHARFELQRKAEASAASTTAPAFQK